MKSVSSEQLQELAAILPQDPPQPASSYKGASKLFDLEGWIADHDIEVQYRAPWGSGEKWVLTRCVWNADHTDKSAFILRHQNGAIAAGCHHNSCQGKGWPEFREIFEPGYLERRESFGAVHSPEPPSTNGNGQHPTKPLWAFPNTDLGNSERLVAMHGEDLRYCWAWGKWLGWDGKRWNPNLPAEVGRRAALTVRCMYSQASELARSASSAESEEERGKLSEAAEALLKWARQSESRARIEGMIMLAKVPLEISPEALDSDPDLLNCANGTVHLPTGELQGHLREDLITKLAPAAYIRYVPLDNLWIRFVEEALPDRETHEYVQKLAGYTLSGRPDQDLVIFCHGPGGTGKSTFLEAFRSALGDYAASADITTFTTKRDPHSPQPDLARLVGKRLVAIPEAQESGGVVSLLKAVSGGDAIPTRSHHQETFDMEPTFTLWLRANKRPHIPHDDSGVWRRINEIPFKHIFSSPDESIRRSLKSPAESGSGILSWAVEGYLKYLEYGLKPSEAVLNATREYREDMDPLAEFLEERAVITESAWVSTRSSFAEYKDWAKNAGVGHPLGKIAFGHYMGGQFTPLNKGRRGGRGFLGVGLVSGHETLHETLRSDTDATFQDPNEGKIQCLFENDSPVGKNYDLNVASVAPDTECNVSDDETLSEPAAQTAEMLHADNTCFRCLQAVPTDEIFEYGPPLVCNNCAVGP